MAKTYGLQRSKVRAILNVAVLQKADLPKPVEAKVNGVMKNLLGQTQPLEFQMIREGEAVYYIAQFRFTDDEILNFELEIQPQSVKETYTVEFKQHFYAD